MKTFFSLFTVIIAVSFFYKSQRDLPSAEAYDDKLHAVKATRNGENWAANGIWLFAAGDPMRFGITIVSGDSTCTESLVFVRLPAAAGRYQLSGTAQSEFRQLPGCVYTIARNGHLQMCREIDDRFDNHIVIDTFDRDRNMVKGRFSLHLKGGGDGYPEQVVFENGEFVVGLMR